MMDVVWWALIVVVVVDQNSKVFENDATMFTNGILLRYVCRMRKMYSGVHSGVRMIAFLHAQFNSIQFQFQFHSVLKAFYIHEIDEP